MLGDQAPLREIADVKNRFGAALLVDEAHSLGVLGEHGRGLAEALDVEADVDFITGTFSKSLGAIGGFCVSRLSELEYVRYAMRPYIFTASSSPSLIASTRKALEILRRSNTLRKKLWDNATQLYQGLAAMGFELGPEISPVIAVRLPASVGETTALWNELLAQGIYVNLVLPPATPGGRPLLRCSLSAAHSQMQINAILDAFSLIGEKLQSYA